MTGSYDPIKGLQVLNEHGVRYVVIGGFAGVILGSSLRAAGGKKDAANFLIIEVLRDERRSHDDG